MKVKDIPAGYGLVQNGDEVAELSEYLGLSPDDSYPYLFVATEEGEIIGAYGSFTCGLDSPAYLVL